ncbi:MAG: helix-turn-helix domain-containing protein [Candidatus Omnitrophota bacterium]
MKNERLITVDEMAAKLNVPASWIYQRTRLGQQAIPHVRVGKYVRFNPDEVVSFLRRKGEATEV